MHFVHLEDGFHPSAGYQVNLLSKLQVKQGHQVTIVTTELDKIPDHVVSFFGKENIQARDAEFTKNTGVKIVRMPLLSYYSSRAIYYPSIFEQVRQLNPDVLFLHGLDTFGVIMFLLRYKSFKFPMVTDSHMLEMASKNKFNYIFRFVYKHLITPIIIKNKIPVIRLVDSDYVEKYLGIPLSSTTILSFGTDVEYFSPNQEACLSFRKKYDIAENAFVILYAGKLDESKGGLFLAKSIRDKFVSKELAQDIVIIIVGNTVGQYGQQVEEEFSNSKNRIIRFPTQAYIDLAEFYQSVNLVIFPKQCSMSFFEVQSCGVPVVLERNEINDIRVNYNNGVLFNQNDTVDFREKIQAMINASSEDYTLMCNNARKYIVDNFNYAPIAKQYTELMEKTYYENHTQTSK